MVVNRRMTGSALAVAMICASRAAIATCNPVIWPSSACSAGRSSAGIVASSAATSALSSAKPRPPGAATTPSGELAAQTVHQLGALLDEEFGRSFDPARRLLVDALDRDKAHVRAPHCRADRGRVARIRSCCAGQTV
jgi:hypothetical protein